MESLFVLEANQCFHLFFTSLPPLTGYLDVQKVRLACCLLDGEILIHIYIKQHTRKKKKKNEPKICNETVSCRAVN